MAFVNPLLLLGILAVAIPIIIQLLTRRHSRKIPWGAMVFLQAAMHKRRRKVLLEEILLLACRCLLPALAALALARPFITPDSRVPWVVVLPAILLAIVLFGASFALWRYPKWRRLSMGASFVLAALVAAAILFERQLNLSRLGGGANKDVAIVIDGSASMSMVGADGKSNFDHALEEAAKYIEEASRGTAFAFLLGGPVPEVLNPVPVSDRRVLRDTLAQLRPSQGTMRAPAALTAAAVTLAAGNNTVKQIIVVGDGQTVGWDLTSDARLETIRSLFSQFRTPPHVVWRTLPLPASIRNLAVADVTLSRDLVGTDREVAIRVTVRNTGTEAVTPEGVSLAIGPKVLKAKDARQLEPGGSQTFEFRHRFEKAGAAVLAATVEAHDDLPADDTLRHIVPVLDAVRVLVVDGDGSGPALSRSSTYLSLALRPEMARAAAAPGGGPSAAERAGFLLETTVEDVARAASRTDFSTFAAVALCNVPRLSDATMQRLGDFVRDGGGLLVLPGAKAKPAAYNAWTSAGEPVLPMALGPWNARDPDQADPPTLDTASFTHEALRALRTGSDLGSLAPLQRRELAPIPGVPAAVAASLSDGTPILAFRPLGRGSVALCAIPFDPIASDLANRRSFVPFVHELVYFLARPVAAGLNVPPTDGATLLLAPRTASSASSAAGGSGLIARYFPARGFKGEPRFRIDPNIDFSWGGGAPLKDFPSDNFCAAWSGSLVPPADGDYAFRFVVDDRASLRIDGKAVLTGNVGNNGPKTDVVRLRKGRRTPIEVRFEEDGGEAYCRLQWKGPGDADFRAVPASALVADAASVVEATDPRGERFFAELAQGALGTVLRISRSLVPGLYTVRPPEGGFPAALAPAITPEGTIDFYVRAGIEESEMHAISPEQADRLRRFFTLSLATKPEDVVSILHGSAFGQEIWRVFAVATLLFLVLEIALARWISIQRREGQETDVDFTNEGEMGKASFKDALKRLRGK